MQQISKLVFQMNLQKAKISNMLQIDPSTNNAPFADPLSITILT